LTTKRFVNLTNGIEAIPTINGEYGFIRIQSTACEQKRWDFIVQELDYSFLMALALGQHVVIYDFGANKRVPRAVYQGVSFVQYVLNRRWFGRETKALVRGNDSTRYFAEMYDRLEERTLKKLDYFKKFLLVDRLSIELVTESTDKDGDYSYYRGVLEGLAS
jgi:hypothetical protein